MCFSKTTEQQSWLMLGMFGCLSHYGNAAMTRQGTLFTVVCSKYVNSILLLWKLRVLKAI